MYTAFKITTAIRLAARLQASLGVRVVPIFWLASEDHDFGEINHTYLVQRDGEIGRVAFGWAGDHVEPGVSCTADTLKPFEHPNTALQVFSCVGNKARVISGRAKGATGSWATDGTTNGS